MEASQVSTYTIKHGEVGFDILKDGEIFRVGIVSREDARWAIRYFEKHEATIAGATKAIADLRQSLKDFYGIGDAEISKLLLIEAARGAE
jgi:hypothetical protein